MTLFTRKQGDGPPLIILHGLYGSSDNWLTIAGMLASHYTVYLPDQRNHGQSPHSEEHNYLVMAEDLHELTQKVSHNGKTIIIGHSMGGKTAMTYAVKYPDSVEALIIADISPFSHQPHDKNAALFHEKVLKALIGTDLSRIKRRDEAKEQIKASITDNRTAGFIMKNLYRTRSGDYLWRLNAVTLLERLPEIMDSIPVYKKEMPPVTGFPVLFIRGGESDYLPDKHLKEALRLFPAASVVTIPETGHWLHAEKPDEFTRAVKEFLDCNC